MKSKTITNKHNYIKQNVTVNIGKDILGTKKELKEGIIIKLIKIM